MTIRLFKAVILFLMAFIFSACNGGSGTISDSSGTTQVTLSLEAPSSAAKQVFSVYTSTPQSLLYNNYTSASKIPYDIATIFVTVSGTDFTQFSVKVPAVGRKVIFIPNGKDRIISVECKNGAGVVVYLGKATIPAANGTAVTLPIKLVYPGGLSVTYGGSKEDVATLGKQTADGGLFLTANTRSFGNYSTSTLAMKLKSNGNVVWQKAYSVVSPDPNIPGTTVSMTEMSGSETKDGGYFMAGRAAKNTGNYTHLLVAKLNSQGTTEWVNMFIPITPGTGGPYITDKDFATSYDFTDDGGYIISGQSGAFQYLKQTGFWFLKLAPNGAFEWGKAMASTANSDIAPKVRSMGGGIYAATGLASITGAGPPVPAVAVFRFDANGYVGTPYLYTTGTIPSGSVPHSRITSDGGLIVTVTSGTGILVLKFNSNLALQWKKLLNADVNCTAGPITKTADGGVIVGGDDVNGKLLAFKLDQSGTFVWAKRYSKLNTSKMADINENSDGTITITAQNTSPAGDKDIWLIKTDSTGAVPGVTPSPVVTPDPPLTWTDPTVNNIVWGETVKIVNVTTVNPALQPSTTNSAPTEPIQPFTSATMQGDWTITAEGVAAWSMSCTLNSSATGLCTEYINGLPYPWTPLWGYDSTTRYFSLTVKGVIGAGSIGGTVSGNPNNFYVDGHWASGATANFRFVRNIP